MTWCGREEKNKRQETRVMDEMDGKKGDG